MGKINFKESTVPATLNEGELVVVDGVTYVGNASNEPVESSYNSINSLELKESPKENDLIRLSDTDSGNIEKKSNISDLKISSFGLRQMHSRIQSNSGGASYSTTTLFNDFGFTFNPISYNSSSNFFVITFPYQSSGFPNNCILQVTPREVVAVPLKPIIAEAVMAYIGGPNQEIRIRFRDTDGVFISDVDFNLSVFGSRNSLAQ